jgi:hypothetical protein
LPHRLEWPIKQTATLLLLSLGTSLTDHIDGLKLTKAKYEIVAALDEYSCRFLTLQEHAGGANRFIYH